MNQKKVLCQIPPEHCNDFEKICEDYSLEFDFLEHDQRGKHVLMTLNNYCTYLGYLPYQRGESIEP